MSEPVADTVLDTMIRTCYLFIKRALDCFYRLVHSQRGTVPFLRIINPLITQLQMDTTPTPTPTLQVFIPNLPRWMRMRHMSYSPTILSAALKRPRSLNPH
jgi:hypothetical protein